MKKAKPQGWFGVDLEGTLAKHEPGSGIATIGEPILPMVERVKYLIEEGADVRIVTARACGKRIDGLQVPTLDFEQVVLVQDWCEQHLGKRLPVQFWKDYDMEVLFDDRAVEITRNKGIPVAEAAISALQLVAQAYFVSRRTNGTLPENLWESIRVTLGIPVPKEPSRIIVPGR